MHVAGALAVDRWQGAERVQLRVCDLGAGGGGYFRNAMKPQRNLNEFVLPYCQNENQVAQTKIQP